jgi:cysteine synthase A
LNRVTKGIRANVLVKLEYLNPSGSIKDRIALRMIENAEKAGMIKPGYTIVESSSGNTAIALGMVCAVKGYKLKIFGPEDVWTEEKKKILKRFGVEVEVVPIKERESIVGAKIPLSRLKCKEFEEKNPNAWWSRQFSNLDNVAALNEIGREILEQTNYKVEVFVAAIGSGGTLLGVAQVLKKELPDVKIVAVEPKEWPIDPLSKIIKFIPGLTGGILEKIRKSEIVDKIVYVSDKEARSMAYRLSREEGLFCGMSSGANVFVAINEARKLERGKNVATILPDRADRYFSDERFIT